ncbi:hypothetical protein BU251_03860 [Candidatus Velamenicoccus archaeovorus]|uniref:Uncharacterized protein n=1 Tax=Velamenicoccus archaeovorus TaxID=1930593 RepID=A0A410P433_VELA1|nr:hypothetical protein BU251_03860 [Candidatus Velamenicoccus archaeovorus]
MTIRIQANIEPPYFRLWRDDFLPAPWQARPISRAPWLASGETKAPASEIGKRSSGESFSFFIQFLAE